MGSRRHVSALNCTLKATGLDRSDLHAALVGFAKVLAKRMDAEPEPGPSLRLMSMYRSVVRDVMRAAETMPTAKPDDSNVSVLDELRRRRHGETEE